MKNIILIFLFAMVSTFYAAPPPLPVVKKLKVEELSIYCQKFAPAIEQPCQPSVKKCVFEKQSQQVNFRVQKSILVNPAYSFYKNGFMEKYFLNQNPNTRQRLKQIKKAIRTKIKYLWADSKRM